MAGTTPDVSADRKNALVSLPEHRLDALLSRHAMVERELSTSLSPDEYVKLSREFSELGPVVQAIKAFRAADGEMADLDAMINDSSVDSEMRDMAQSERSALQDQREKLEHEIRLALLPKDAMD